MAQCRAITRSGTRCTATVSAGVEWCWNHDPALQEQRRRNASRAGKSRPNREVQSLRDLLTTLHEEVRGGDVETKVGAVLNQILNTRLRLVELERKVREQDELEDRITELEQRAATMRQARR